MRVLCVNTGGGLRYRVLLDRGMDIDHAFVNQHSLAFLSHKGVTPPLRGLDRHVDWFKSFPGGLLTSCGPFNIGPPGNDAGEDLPLHGVHSGTAASLESVLQPDPRAGKSDMSITGVGVADSPQQSRVELARLGSGQTDQLVSLDRPARLDLQALAHPVLHLAFGPGDEERPGEPNPVEPHEIHIAAIEHLNWAGLKHDLIEHRDIGDLFVRNPHKHVNCGSSAARSYRTTRRAPPKFLWLFSVSSG